MVNQVFKGQKNTYTCLRELGRGGEGQVFELANNYTLVLKIYTEPLSSLKIRKLRLMASLLNTAVQQYAAWPEDVVTGANNLVAGFVMKKLVDYYPLHMLFSPMDRKKLFPDKGYNFLVHVAGNLARAFHTLHAAGLVVGDVNEGNILVNAQGMIAFIDCDSFQVKEGSEYHFCEVGVPRYTPPELLEKTSFNNIVRTVNTDSFSMAVLIFQLLFLGRHPFAGRNITAEDIDEETAIKKHLFAYSLTNKYNKLLPPKDSFAITNLNSGLSTLFHAAFEGNEGRPTPAMWMKELDVYLKAMIICPKTKIHVYPATLSACIWCDFRDKQNILFFLDDSYISNSQALSDIDRFINGFKVEKLNLPHIDLSSIPLYNLSPAPIEKKYMHIMQYQLMSFAGLLVSIICVCYFMGVWGISVCGLAWSVLRNQLPWKKQFRAELKKREADSLALSDRIWALKKEYDKVKETADYNECASRLTGFITHFKKLPAELQAQKRAIEEKAYNAQLDLFLSAFYLEHFTIPSIGDARKQVLIKNGICSAADVTKLQHIKVQGIGPTYTQALLTWRRQMSSTFVYRPDNNLLNREYNLLVTLTESIKKTLETNIRKEHQSLHFIKTTIINKRALLQKQIEKTHLHEQQAIVDLSAFKKIRVL